ncbi:MAG: hypothetical protein ACLPX9_16105 [Rhodomicrobium sp.]
MKDRKNAIAKYVAVEKQCRTGAEIFASLNAIRCEFAICNGHESYIALCNDGSKESVPIHWECFQAEGLRRPVSAGAGRKRNRLSELIAHAVLRAEEFWNSMCGAGTRVDANEPKPDRLLARR